MSKLMMDEITYLAAHGTDEEVRKKLGSMVETDRRVVSRKETIGYMLFDANNGFNIDGHKSLFTDSILKIDLGKQSLFNAIGGVWDIVDDMLIGSVIEKTRTRWGKFVPYLFLAGIPSALVSCVYWLLPALFSQAHVDDLNYLPNFFAFLLLEMVLEGFSVCSFGGYGVTC